jgi:phage baseplate assembly protein W
MQRLLSDYNESRSSNVARVNLYSDIDMNFSIHPLYNDVLPIYDLDSIKQNLKNLLLTNQYDRLFQPEIYSNIASLLFEPADGFTEISLQTNIERIIDLYEPRISAYDVEVTDDSDSNAYRVFIKFQVSYNLDSEIVIYLTRIR